MFEFEIHNLLERIWIAMEGMRGLETVSLDTFSRVAHFFTHDFSKIDINNDTSISKSEMKSHLVEIGIRASRFLLLDVVEQLLVMVS